MVLEIKSLEELENMLKDSPKLVVDLWAIWCQPCKVSAPIYSQISEDPDSSEIKFTKIEADKVEGIIDKYGIRSIPTFIAFKDGIESGRVVGFKGKEEFKKWLEQSLL